jgi:hypothetical protein
MPATVTVAPAGAWLGDDVDGDGARVGAAEGAAVLGEKLGALGKGEMVTKPPCVARWTPKTAKPNGIAMVPMMKKAAKTHQIRLRDGGRGDVQGDGLQ